MQKYLLATLLLLSGCAGNGGGASPSSLAQALQAYSQANSSQVMPYQGAVSCHTYQSVWFCY